ncbi:MAG: 7-carboxy-7-deazaguanine synthase QueE [Lacibacter sp.]
MSITATIAPPLPVMEMFYTLQGEGRHSGRAAYFIRLGGCDVGCVWCDVKESWDAEKHPRLSIAAIVAHAVQEVHSHCGIAATAGTAALQLPAALPAVVTGGEPLMHNLDALTEALQAAGFRTHIETSGAHPLSGRWDWICLSPKKFKAPLPEILPLVHELKVVIYHKSDFAWAEQYAAQVQPGCKLYLQPEWEKAAAVTPLIVDYIKAHPQWQLSLQIHKYIHVP